MQTCKLHLKWFKNGKIKEICYYKHDQRHGECKGWSSDGRLDYHTLYEHGLNVRTFKGPDEINILCDICGCEIDDYRNACDYEYD